MIFVLCLMIFACCISSNFYEWTRTQQTKSIASSQDTISLPIIMYHSVLKNRQSKYTIHPDELERDIIKYKEMGYTPVLLREVADWVNNGTQLPEKPMIITFDDGHYNNLHYALPILQKHNAKAVINVITSYSRFATDSPANANNPNFSYLTFDNIRTLHESGIIEIGNHTHSMHKFKPRYGITKLGNETLDEYKTALRTDIEKANTFLTENSNIPRPITFAYPFGKHTKSASQIIQELGFQAMLTCNEGISQIRRGDQTSLHSLKRYNRNGKARHEDFIKKVFGDTETQTPKQ